MKLRGVSLLAVLLLACEPDAGDIIGVVGDSKADFILEQLHESAALLRDGMPVNDGDGIFPLAVVPCAALGRDFAYFGPRVSSWTGGETPRIQVDKVLVVLLTNDASELDGVLTTWPYVDEPAELAAKIDGLMGALPDVPVLWMAPGSPLTLPERKTYLREGLVAAQGRWPKLAIMDEDPSWFAGGDGVHYSAEGEAHAAGAMIARLESL